MTAKATICRATWWNFAGEAPKTRATAEALPGWEVSVAAGAVKFSPRPESIRHLPPGEVRAMGWLRLEPAPVHVEVTRQDFLSTCLLAACCARILATGYYEPVTWLQDGVMLSGRRWIIWPSRLALRPRSVSPTYRGQGPLPNLDR